MKFTLRIHKEYTKQRTPKYDCKFQFKILRSGKTTFKLDFKPLKHPLRHNKQDKRNGIK